MCCCHLLLLHVAVDKETLNNVQINNLLLLCRMHACAACSNLLVIAASMSPAWQAHFTHEQLSAEVLQEVSATLR